MDHDDVTHNSNDSNPRLSNTEHDFEDITHSEAVDNHDDAWREDHTASAVQHEPAVPMHAHLENRVSSGSMEESEVTESRFDLPPQPAHCRIEHRGDMDEPPRHNFMDDDDDVKAASEASEMLKQHMPPKVRNIVYWNCPLTSAALLISLLLFEFSLLFFSVISVLAYTGLAIMVISLALKLYTRDLFLINNYGESIKFGIFLYVLTYIGAWFNFLTLVILATVFTFSIPKVYDIYKREIDHVIRLARRQFKEKWVVVRGKMEELPVVGQKLKRN